MTYTGSRYIVTPSYSMRRLKFIIEYDGRNYHGWQRQPTFSSIQQTLEDTIQKITKYKTVVIGSGRTDSGVHSLGQVAHCDLLTELNDAELRRAINSQLPIDIVIKKLKTVAQTFHAQKSVTSKTYIYQILNDFTRSPLLKDHSWLIVKPLNVDIMNQAAQKILGEHDFKSFQNSGSSSLTTTRKIFKSTFKEKRPFILYRIEGNGFLKQMVRNLVGAFVRIGSGKMTLKDFDHLLYAKDRRLCPPPAPARGLCLKKVTYI